MPITERLESAEDVLRWEDKIPFHYEYTAGVAGERFLRGLMQARILAGYCAECERASLPARMYCVECYSPIRKFVKIEPRGKVRAKASKGSEAYAFVTFRGVRGGIVSRLLGDAGVGDAVVPRFRPKRERTGSVNDLLGFERPPGR